MVLDTRLQRDTGKPSSSFTNHGKPKPREMEEVSLKPKAEMYRSVRVVVVVVAATAAAAAAASSSVDSSS